MAPTYKMANVGWRGIQQIARQIPHAEIRQVERIVTFPGGGWVQVRSADDPQSLRGEGLDFLVVDECAFLREEAWSEALRPSLTDRHGRALFISTPKGRNWFWKLWTRGQGDDAEWRSWQFPTESNPYIDPDEIEAARQLLPERTFRQEYLADFIEGAGAVFRNVDVCCTLEPSTPEEHEGHELVAGIDWGKVLDYTVVSVGCRDCKCEVALDRFHGVEYRLARQRIAVLVEKWHIYDILAESNSIGTPVIEEMVYGGLPVRPFETTASSKPPLIENLVLCLEREEVRFLNDPTSKIELEAFEMKASPNTGRPTYSAPDGMHDDTVIARALMLNAMQLRGSWMTLL